MEPYTNGTIQTLYLEHFPVGIAIDLPHSFEWLSGIPLMECTLQLTLVDGHFRCFQSLAFKNISVTNISGHISLHT